MSAQDDIDENSAARIDLWSVQWCGYCRAARRLLEAKGIAYRFHDLTGRNEEVYRLKQQTGHRTMPQIFVDDRLIGGFDELRAYIRDNGAEALFPSAQ